MARVKVSKKFQVVIPLEIRKKMNLSHGQQLNMFFTGGRIELVPDENIAEMEGKFPGLSLQGIREDTERL